LKFSFQPKRWLPFFILDSVFFLAAIALLYNNLNDILGFFLAATTSPAAVVPLIGYALILLAGFVVWAFIRLWINGAVIHQSTKPKEFGQSWGVAKNRYLSMFAVTLVTGIISGVVGMAPYIGWLLSIIIGLMFFFVLPAVVAKKLSFDNALRDSYHIFRQKILAVFLIWIVTSLISLLITFIFMIPCIMLVWNAIMPFLFQASSAGMASLIVVSMMQNIWMLALCVEVFLIGLAVSNTFVLKAQTDFYLHFKKKKFGLF